MLAHLPPEYRLLLIGHDVDHQYRREIDAAMGPELRRRVIFTGKARPLADARAAGADAPVGVRVPHGGAEPRRAGGARVGHAGARTLQRDDRRARGRPASADGCRRTPPRNSSRGRCARSARRTRDSYAEHVPQTPATRAHPSTGRNNHRPDGTDVRERAGRAAAAIRRGTLALPLLLAAAQMLISMIMYLILQIAGPPGAAAARAGSAPGRSPRAVPAALIARRIRGSFVLR